MARREFLDHFAELERKNASLLKVIDDLREQNNEALAPLCKALREEALQAWNELKQKTLDMGEFHVVVPVSETTDVKAFWRAVWQKGGEQLAQQALDDGILEQVVAIPKDGKDRLEQWAAKHGLSKELAECQDEAPQTPRVSAAHNMNHEIPPLGIPYKPAK